MHETSIMVVQNQKTAGGRENEGCQLHVCNQDVVSELLTSVPSHFHLFQQPAPQKLTRCAQRNENTAVSWGFQRVYMSAMKLGIICTTPKRCLLIEY
eukprot:m.77272 g.77272  ORF g.77272 m.77272 type:complete len:97 (-) comp16193_c0_seq2:418-708(-)